ncbi:MAG: acyl-CoA thioesterase [Gordonia sp. (in: high G+C Gram-positive bacteria)]|uniref:acyl-CoA thioesterase n=1 Tax=Gordonia sp. (in: high G+C Gram-positive bacteria) TaxID=84139 RepID=UPI0039E5C6C0
MSDQAASRGPYVAEIALRWADQDIYRHVNNVQTARLFEEARVRTFAAWFPGPRPEGIAVVVARQEFEYTAPLYYSEEPARCEVWVSRIGTKSYDLACRLSPAGGGPGALAETTLTVIDRSTGRGAEIPAAMRAVLDEHVGDPVPFRRRA